jgi:quaternary ammonium compound-resistance protein SugE
MNAWVTLLLAGVFEVGFTTFMKLSNDFTKWIFTGLFILSASISFSLLSLAMKTIPLGTAYAVWTGIGAAGTALVGMIFFKDPVSFGRIFFLSLLIGSVAGLKMVSAQS